MKLTLEKYPTRCYNATERGSVMRRPDTIFREFGTATQLTLSSSGYPSYAPHSADSIEMWYLIKGEVDATCNGQTVHLTEGDYFLVFPNQMHAYENISKDNYMITIIMQASKLSHYKKFFADMVPTCPACHPEDKRLFRLLEIAMKEYNNGSDEKVVNSILTAFFGKLLGHYELVPNPIANNKVSEVLAYCQSHFKENITLDKISNELFISRSYLSYIFNKKLKVSFSDYISSLRLNEVLELIEGQGYSISQAAYEAGFSGISNFNRVFKKTYGVSPREFLAQNAAKAKGV